MKRILLAAAILFAMAIPASAATYILNADGTVTAQTAPPVSAQPDLTQLRNPVISEKPGCICGPDCACKPGVCPGGCPVATVAAPVAGHYEQQCTTDSRGRKSCRTVWVPDEAAGPLFVPVERPEPTHESPLKDRTVGAPATVSGDLFGFKMSATVDVPTGPLAKLRAARAGRGGLFSRLANRPRLFGRAGGGCASCGQ